METKKMKTETCIQNFETCEECREHSIGIIKCDGITSSNKMKTEKIHHDYFTILADDNTEETFTAKELTLHYDTMYSKQEILLALAKKGYDIKGIVEVV